MIFISVVYLQDSAEYTHNLFIKTDISQLLDIKDENNTSQMQVGFNWSFASVIISLYLSAIKVLLFELYLTVLYIVQIA